MAGMPKRRAKREAAARQALTEKAKAMEPTAPNPNSKYSDELADQIAVMVADGTPIDTTKVGNDIAVCGVESKVGVSASTIYRWQQERPDFAEKIRKARIESADRIADKCNALADVALDNPHMAQACKVASDILKWTAGVRNKNIYGESRRVEVEITADLGDRLMRAEQRVIEEPTKLIGTQTVVDAEIVGTVQ